MWHRYAWADNTSNALADAATFTVVKGLTPRQALQVLAPDAATPVGSVAAAQSWADRQPYRPTRPNAHVIAAGSRDGWTIILEDNGFRATTVAKQLSRRGVAVVVYNNVDALASFQYARDGRLVRHFDPLSYASYGRQSRLRQERGISFGKAPYPYLAQSLLLTERLTGFHTQPSDLDLADYPLAVGVRV